MHFPVKKLKLRKSFKIHKGNEPKLRGRYEDHLRTPIKDEKSKTKLFYQSRSTGSPNSRESSCGSSFSSSHSSSSLSTSSFDTEAYAKELATWKEDPNSTRSSCSSGSNNSQNLAPASDVMLIRKGNPTSTLSVKSRSKSVSSGNNSDSIEDINLHSTLNQKNLDSSKEDSDSSFSISDTESEDPTELFDHKSTRSKAGKTGLGIILKKVPTNLKTRRKKTRKPMKKSVGARKSRSSLQENEECVYSVTLPQTCGMETALSLGKNNDSQLELQEEEFSSKCGKPETSQQERSESRIAQGKKGFSKNQNLGKTSLLKTKTPLKNTKDVTKLKKDGKRLDSYQGNLKKVESFKIKNPSKIIFEPVSKKKSSLNILEPKVNKSDRLQGKPSSRTKSENSVCPIKTRKKIVKTVEQNKAVMGLDYKLGGKVAPIAIKHTESKPVIFYLPEENQPKRRRKQSLKNKRDSKEVQEELLKIPVEKDITVAYVQSKNEDAIVFPNSGLIKSKGGRTRGNIKNISKGSVGNTVRMKGSINDQTRLKNMAKVEKSSLSNQSNMRKTKSKIPANTKNSNQEVSNHFKETSDFNNNVAPEVGSPIKKGRNDTNKFNPNVKLKADTYAKNRPSRLKSYVTKGSASNQLEVQNNTNKRVKLKRVKRKIIKQKKLLLSSKSKTIKVSESPRYSIRNISNIHGSYESKKNERFVEVQRLENLKWSRLPAAMLSGENSLNKSLNTRSIGRDRVSKNQSLGKKTTTNYSTSLRFQGNSSSRSEIFNRWKNMYSQAKPVIVQKAKRASKKLDLERINALAKPRHFSEIKKPSQVLNRMPESAGEPNCLDSSRAFSKASESKTGQDRNRVEEHDILSIAQSILLTNWNILDVKNRNKISGRTSSAPLLQLLRSSCRNTNLNSLEDYPWNDIRNLANHQTYSYGSRVP